MRKKANNCPHPKHLLCLPHRTLLSDVCNPSTGATIVQSDPSPHRLQTTAGWGAGVSVLSWKACLSGCP